MSELRKIKMGELFFFPDMPSVIWIKCRGGFRLGRGGELHACAPHVPVIRYTMHDPINDKGLDHARLETPIHDQAPPTQAHGY